MPYHDTVPENPGKIKDLQRKVNDQEREILNIFIEFKNPLAPHQVWSRIAELHPLVPITSVRRSMTDLSKMGYLDKTGGRVMGHLGSSVNTWGLKSGQLKLF